jgi:predicted Rossmann fold nucleotide-binding protein DprA/Smf involved in DNA uptake
VKVLLERGFVLSQAFERWQARGISVISRADDGYPKRFRERLKDSRPLVLYYCGDITSIDVGGLAIVGSRNVSDDGLRCAQSVGRVCAESGIVVVSGGARGVDALSMQAALDAGGRVIGVLSDSLEAAVLSTVWRDGLQDGRLLLVSPYDPRAGFNVGNAMGRNKMIYALANAALVVDSDIDKGGTWSGAVEQLDKLRYVPLYVRNDESPGLKALAKRGACMWPEAIDAQEMRRMLESTTMPEAPAVDTVPSALVDVPAVVEDVHPGQGTLFSEPTQVYVALNSDELWSTARRILLQVLQVPRKEADVAAMIGVEKSQAKAWLKRLSDEGVVQKVKTVWKVG